MDLALFMCTDTNANGNSIFLVNLLCPQKLADQIGKIKGLLVIYLCSMQHQIMYCFVHVLIESFLAFDINPGRLCREGVCESRFSVCNSRLFCHQYGRFHSICGRPILLSLCVCVVYQEIMAAYPANPCSMLSNIRRRSLLYHHMVWR